MYSDKVSINFALVDRIHYFDCLFFFCKVGRNEKEHYYLSWAYKAYFAKDLKCQQ